MPVRTNVWDRIGIGLSGLCALHCLVTPVLLAVLPLWPHLDAVHEWLHPVFALLLLPVTLVALWGAARARRPQRIGWLLGGGLSLVVLAALLPHAAGSLSGTGTTLVGSVLLIGGHLTNWRAAHGDAIHHAKA